MSFPRYAEYKDSGVEWLGEVPGHWGVYALKRLARLVYGDSLPAEARAHDGDVPVFGSNGAFGTHDHANTEAPVIFVGRKGSCGALNWSHVPSFGIDTVYYVDGRACGENLKWLFWGLHVADLTSASQDTGVPGLPREFAHEVRLPCPAAEEQSAIVAFLDRETGKIDALVAEQETLIGLLKEKRQAVISHAVTKGLDPTAPMKDSGIEWLGEVPEHWEVKRLKHLSPQITVGIVVNPSNYVAVEGLPFLYGGDISEGQINVSGARRISREDSDRNKKTQLREGDIVTVRVGAPGISAVVPNECGGGNCASVMLTRKGNFRSDWLCFAMNSRMVRYQVEVVQYGAAQEQFNISHAVDFWVATPPRPEQDAIAGHLLSEMTKIDALITEAQRGIDLLKERRSALISAAVTGRIDVRGLVAADVTEAA